MVFDVDGVLTDGTVFLDQEGREWKRLRYRDLDAITEARTSGVRLGLLSGETGPMVEQIAARLGIHALATNAKDKVNGLTTMARDAGVPLARVCYVGDSDRDAPALVVAGIGLAPRDASPRARRAADAILRCGGGEGVAAEALAWLAGRGHLRRPGTR